MRSDTPQFFVSCLMLGEIYIYDSNACLLGFKMSCLILIYYFDRLNLSLFISTILIVKERQYLVILIKRKDNT